MKYKVGDILKIINPAYPSYPEYRYNFRNRICKVIETNAIYKFMYSNTKYHYKVKFIDNKESPEDTIDYYYDDKEVIKLTKEEAMLEIL